MIENAPLSQEWQKLKDIPLPDDRIENGIADLVRALTGLGIKTNESCEGHLKWNKIPIPRVTFSAFPFMYPDVPDLSAKFARLHQAIQEYNSKSPIKWQVHRHYVMPTIKASNMEELTTLQANASQFANFIFENYIKKPTNT